jgi:disulfide bond formation protein DsbB
MNGKRNFDYLILPGLMLVLVVGIAVSANLIIPGQLASVPQVIITIFPSATPTQPATATPIPPTAVADASVPAAADASASGDTAGGTQNVSLADFDSIAVEHGRSQFQTTCAACHGSNARGIPGLGKDLVAGEYVRVTSDEEMIQFIIEGRQAFDPANTTGVQMPPRGGNPMLTDEQIREIVVYLRYSAASELGAAPAEVTGRPDVPTEVTSREFVLPIEAMGLDTVEEAAPDMPAEVPAEASGGTEFVSSIPGFDAVLAYNLSCAGCHGLNGEGTPFNGPAIVGNMLLVNAPDAVFNYLTLRQPPVDPRNDFPHPINAEYPSLNEEQLRAVIDYSRTLGQ